MAFRAAILAVLVCSDSTALVGASTFLEPKTSRETETLNPEEVRDVLLGELSGFADADLKLIEEELRPMYLALPQSATGRLEPTTVRYALHRYFVQKHGWYMSGLEPRTAQLNSATPSVIMKDRAPAYIQSIFEENMHGQGLGLHELSVFAAALTDLIHKEAAIDLHKIFDSLRLPTVDLSRKTSDLVIKGFLMAQMIGGNISFRNMREFYSLEKEMMDIYPSWDDTMMWVNDQRELLDVVERSSRNPFVQHKESYDSVLKFVRELGHNYGSFQNLECRTLKSRLVDMEHQGTGRVPLSRFYAGGTDGDWTFTESVEYLRNLGALDETDPRRPSVMIPNYIHSQTNCLSSSGFYSVCCSDECEDLLQQVEMKIAAPSALPEHIVGVVSVLRSDTVDAPRNVSSTLSTRLQEIASLHGGRVPLHGRLFAQWMHHAYPRECPFPHAAGTTSPMSPDDWMSKHGIDSLEATQEVMQSHYAMRDQLTDNVTGVALPWSSSEELLAGYIDTVVDHVAPERALKKYLRVAMIFAAVASMAIPLVHASKSAMTGPMHSKSEKHLV